MLSKQDAEWVKNRGIALKAMGLSLEDAQEKIIEELKIKYIFRNDIEIKLGFTIQKPKKETDKGYFVGDYSHIFDNKIIKEN